MVNDVAKLMTECERVAISDVALVSDDPKCILWKFGLIPRLFRPFSNSAHIA